MTTSALSVKLESSAASWNSVRTEKLVELFKHYTPTNYTDGGFKTETWTKIKTAFNEFFHLAYNNQQLQSKFAILKKQFSVMKALREQSGFGWDETTSTVTADESVWVSYLAVHSEAAQFKSKGLPNYDSLEFIFSGKVATGKYATTSYTSFISPNASSSNSTPDANVTDLTFGIDSDGIAGATPLEGGAKRILSLDLTGNEKYAISKMTKIASPILTPRAKQTDGIIKLLSEIKSNQVQANAPRRALELFNKFLVENQNDFSAVQKLAIKTKLSKTSAAEVYLSCTSLEEVKEYLAVCAPPTSVTKATTPSTKHYVHDNERGPNMHQYGRNTALGLPLECMICSSNFKENKLCCASEKILRWNYQCVLSKLLC